MPERMEQDHVVAAPVRRVSAAGRRPEARPGPVQSIRPTVHAMPSAGLPAGAVNPTGLDPRPPPRRRGPRQGRRGAEGNGAERRPQGLALTGWRRAVGWSRCPVGPHAARGRDEQRCRGRHNAVTLVTSTTHSFSMVARDGDSERPVPPAHHALAHRRGIHRPAAHRAAHQQATADITLIHGATVARPVGEQHVVDPISEGVKGGARMQSE